MNWGNKLVIVFLAFGTLIGYLVYRCMDSSVDLVSKDYYKEELAYQEIINGRQNAASLSSEVNVTQQNKRILICLPPEMKNTVVTGDIRFYCPAGSAKDRMIKMNPDSHACQEIPAGLLSSGVYTMKLRWQQEGREYFYDQSLIIP